MPSGFLSPGAAAVNAIEETLLRREELARQARLDQQAEEVHRSKMQDAQEARERQRLKDTLDLEDRERDKVKEETAGMVIGDQFNPELLGRARASGAPLRTSVAPPSPVAVQAPDLIQELSADGQSGETPVAPLPTGNIRFAGSPAQAKVAEDKAAQQKFIESLASGRPATGGTGAAQSAAARSVGLPMSAADFEPSADRAKSATVQEYEFYKAEETAAGRQPLGFDAYQARDANRKRPVTPTPLPGGMDPKLMGVIMTLGSKLTSDPVYRDMLDVQTGKIGVEQGIARKTGLGDIAAINAFQRMVDPGATVREGDVKLIQSANAFLERMNPSFWMKRLEQGDKLPEKTRQEMLKLSKELYKVRARNYDQMTGKKFKGLAKAAGVDYGLIGQDFDDPDDEPFTESGGVPQVGGSFQGGKVLKVTPLP